MAMNERDLQDAEERRPYAAASNVVSVLQRARTRNLPEVIDDDFFRIVEIPDVVFGRVREALRFIGMIEPDGRPTETLRAISAASDEEYHDLLSGSLRRAYETDFTRIDPSEDTQTRIVNAFRRYQPRSQTARMVMMFLGLCREAGIPVVDAPRERQMQRSEPRRASPAARPRPRSARSRSSGNQEAMTNEQQAANGSGTLFGVTEADIAALSEAEFVEVWTVLGKVVRARAQRKGTPPTPEATDKADDPEEGGNS